jgi:hypothetical protein
MEKIETLIKLLERVGVDHGCEKFNGLCRDVDCRDCPFWSQDSKDETIAELGKIQL